MQHGRAIEASIARELNLDISAPVHYIKEQRCLEYYFDYTHQESFNQSPSLTADKFQEAFEVIAQKNFRITGDMFVRFLTFFQEDNKEKELNVLYIAVE